MADTKTSALTALTGANVDATADVFPIVDTSVTTTKKILLEELGIALNATQAGQESGTSTKTLVSPAVQQYHPSACKAWASFNSAGTLLASYNTTSVTKNSTGDWTVTIATDFSSANYAAMAWGGHITGVTQLVYLCIAQAAGSLRLQAVRRDTGANADPDTPDVIFFMAFGDQA